MSAIIHIMIVIMRVLIDYDDGSILISTMLQQFLIQILALAFWNYILVPNLNIDLDTVVVLEFKYQPWHFYWDLIPVTN